LGASYTLVKIQISIIPPETFQVIRYFIATIFIALFIKKGDLIIIKNNYKSAVLVGISSFFGSFLSIIGMQMTNATKTAFFSNLTIFIVPLLLFIHYKRKIVKYEIICIAICVIGLTFFTQPWDNETNFWDIILFCSSI
jgi:drug/metabolite transporter (DMT)-like permease